MSEIAAPSLPPIQASIAGSYRDPELTLEVWIHDPSSNAPLAPIKANSREALEEALATADRLHREGTWSDMAAEERAAYLVQMADWLAERANEIAAVESLNTGITIGVSRLVNQITHLTFRAAADMATGDWNYKTLPGEFGDVEVHRKPWGPAACIAPWNAPAALAAHKVANALAAGCPVILKPSEWAPFSATYLAQAAEAAGLPDGVLQIVHGGPDIGAALVADPRIRCVSFTGGLEGGRAVAQACARDFKPLQLELGGNNALVVLDDADLDKAAAGIVAGMTVLNGQWCRALGRLLVQDTVYNDLMERAFDALAAVRVGSALDESSQMGPLVHTVHKERISAAVSRLELDGGAIHQVTPLPDADGAYFAPTLITGVESSATTEEIFGPVAAVHTFQSDDEAVTLANQAPYGLGGYVYGSEARALAIARRMETGGVKVNGVSLIGLHPMAPRPAWKLSGFGEEGTAETYRFFCGTRVVGVAGR